MMSKISCSSSRLAFGAAALFAAGALFAAPMVMPPPTVRVEKVSTVDRSEGKSYVATSSPYALVDVVARVSGTLTKSDFKEG